MTQVPYSTKVGKRSVRYCRPVTEDGEVKANRWEVKSDCTPPGSVPGFPSSQSSGLLLRGHVVEVVVLPTVVEVELRRVTTERLRDQPVVEAKKASPDPPPRPCATSFPGAGTA